MAERARRVAQFRHSGLTRARYAQRTGIALATLDKWLREARGVTGARAPVVLRELKVAPSAGGSAWSVEVVGPDGLTIRFRESVSIAELAGLLRGNGC